MKNKEIFIITSTALLGLDQVPNIVNVVSFFFFKTDRYEKQHFNDHSQLGYIEFKYSIITFLKVFHISVNMILNLYFYWMQTLD